jgi:phage major head subunit gpT-like protein
MTVNTGNIGLRLIPGIRGFYGVNYDRYDGFCKKIFTSIKSNKKFEDFVSLVGTGIVAVKNEGAPMVMDDVTTGYRQRITPLTYGKVVMFTSEAMGDDQYAPKMAERLGKNFALSMRETEEIVAHSLINTGFNTSTSNMYNNPDGKALFATDHPLFKGGSLSNKLSVAADLSQASLEELIIQIRNWKDDAGIRMNIKPMKLIVPTALEFDTYRLLMSDLQAGTADNDTNALKKLGLEIVVDPYLTDSDAWFIETSANGGEEGLLMVSREEVEFGSDNEFLTDNARYKMKRRFGVGYADPRCIAGSEGA